VKAPTFSYRKYTRQLLLALTLLKLCNKFYRPTVRLMGEHRRPWNHHLKKKNQRRKKKNHKRIQIKL
jgi:hypothetical protein